MNRAIYLCKGYRRFYPRLLIQLNEKFHYFDENSKYTEFCALEFDELIIHGEPSEKDEKIIRFLKSRVRSSKSDLCNVEESIHFIAGMLSYEVSEFSELKTLNQKKSYEATLRPVSSKYIEEPRNHDVDVKIIGTYVSSDVEKGAGMLIKFKV